MYRISKIHLCSPSLFEQFHTVHLQCSSLGRRRRKNHKRGHHSHIRRDADDDDDSTDCRHGDDDDDDEGEEVVSGNSNSDSGDDEDDDEDDDESVGSGADVEFVVDTQEEQERLAEQMSQAQRHMEDSVVAAYAGGLFLNVLPSQVFANNSAFYFRFGVFPVVVTKESSTFLPTVYSTS